jgi:hypothetical protein
MSLTLSALLAQEHVADLRRQAESWQQVPRRRRRVARATELRFAGVEDVAVVRQLSDLDEEPELQYPVLLALLDGEAVAGLSINDGRVAANPFVPTTEAVALLRLRAQQLAGGRAASSRRWLRPPRLRAA